MNDDPPDPIQVENAVKIALEIGYRHLDCAPVYEDEAAVGKGISASGVPREEIFITSKLWNTEHAPEDVGPALDNSLKDLGIDYVDLYLIHWPASWVKLDPYQFCPEDANGNMITNDVPIASTWAAMEALVTSGKVRSIGVSNFSQVQLEELISTAKIIPAVNQVSMQPYRQRKELVAWCASRNIHVTAWGPLMLNRGTQSTVATDPALLEIAKSIGITPSQLALSWAVQRGTSVIPKSAQEKRIRANLELVLLSDEIMAKVDGLEIVV